MGDAGQPPAAGESPERSPQGRAPSRTTRFYKAFARVHTRLLVRTKGRPSWSGPRLTFLVLETTGRRSGTARRVVLLYMPEGDHFVVLASNFGGERPPAWWVNLQSEPLAVVYRAGRRIPVRARALDGDTRQAVLSRALAYNPQWRGYSTSLRRELPVVLLERVTTGPSPAG